MGNLTVKDEEHKSLSEMYCQAGNIAEQELSKYLSIMRMVCENAVAEGAMHANLVAFMEEARKLKGFIADITNPASNETNEFVNEIENADEYLYDA